MDGYLSAVGSAVGLAFASAPFERLKEAALRFVQDAPVGQGSFSLSPGRAHAAFLDLCDSMPVDELHEALGACKRAPPNLSVPYMGLGAVLMAGHGVKMRALTEADCVYRVDFDEKTFSRLCSLSDEDVEAQSAVEAWSVPLSDFEKFESYEALANAFEAMVDLSPGWGDDPLPHASERARAMLAARSCSAVKTRFGQNEESDRLRLESMASVSWGQVRALESGYHSKLSYEMYSEEDWARLKSVCGTAIHLGGPGAVLANRCLFKKGKGSWLCSVAWVTGKEDGKADELVKVMGEGVEEMVKRWGINVSGEHGPIQIELGQCAAVGSPWSKVEGESPLDQVLRSMLAARMQGWLDLTDEEKSKVRDELADSDELRQSVAMSAAMSGSMLAAFNPMEALRFLDQVNASGVLGDSSSLNPYARHWVGMPASCIAGASERLIPCWLGAEVPSKFSFNF